jgi:hypothetical protein
MLTLMVLTLVELLCIITTVEESLMPTITVGFSSPANSIHDCSAFTDRVARGVATVSTGDNGAPTILIGAVVLFEDLIMSTNLKPTHVPVHRESHVVQSFDIDILKCWIDKLNFIIDNDHRDFDKLRLLTFKAQHGGVLRGFSHD